MANLITQLSGFHLTTAKILYHLPDHPRFLQTFVWQDYDVAPRYPRLSDFLNFWERELEGKLHSVYVGTQKLITTSELRHARQEFLIN